MLLFYNTKPVYGLYRGNGGITEGRYGGGKVSDVTMQKAVFIDGETVKELFVFDYGVGSNAAYRIEFGNNRIVNGLGRWLWGKIITNIETNYIDINDQPIQGTHSVKGRMYVFEFFIQITPEIANYTWDGVSGYNFIDVMTDIETTYFYGEFSYKEN
jgi:hypothetical protein